MKDESFAEIFRIAAVDDDGVFWHANGDVSYCWLAHPVSAEHLSGAGRHELADTLGRAISTLDGGACVQFIIANVPNIDWALRDYIKNGGSTNKFLHQYELNKAKAFQEWTKGLQSTVGADVTAKTIQVLIVLTITRKNLEKNDELTKSIRDALAAIPAGKTNLAADPVIGTAAHERATEEATMIRETLLAKVVSFKKAFTAMRLPHTVCDVRNFIRFVRTMIHPNTGANEPVIIDDEVLLPEAICRQRVETSGKGKYVVSDGSVQVCMTADAYPQPPPRAKGVYAGILTLNNETIESGLSPIDLLKDSILCVNLRVVETQKAEQWIEHQKSLAGKGSSDRAEDREVFHDCDETLSWIRSERRKLVDMCISLKVNGPTEPAAMDRARMVMKTFDQLGFHFRIEDTDSLTIWSEMLPGGYVGSAGDGGHRYRRKRDIIAACVAPLYMSGRGTRTYSALNFNEHYEPSAFSLFDHSSSYNALFVGQSGSGKSNAMGSIVTDEIRPDGVKAFIIDYGGSYSQTVELAEEDGRDQVLSLEARQPENCFAGPSDITIPMLLNWIPGLFLEDGENLKPTLEALIEKALKTAYDAQLKRNVEFIDYAELSTKYKAYFPTNVRKRFAISYLDSAAFQHVRSVLRGDEVRRPRFELYLVVRIHAFMSEHGHRASVHGLSDLDHSVHEKLTSRFKYLEEDDTGVYVLSPEPNAIEGLTTAGFEASVDTKVMLVEAQRLEDFQSVTHAGARVLYDREFLQEKESSLREMHALRYGHDHADLESYVQEDLKHINPDDYFNWTVGLVDLQTEIIFSDFIRAAKALGHPEMNDCIERLSMWYGNGVYADFFDRPGGIDLSQYKIVNWDFKPIFPPVVSKKFGAAMLGAVLTRINVYCNSITTMGTRKIIVLDEYQQFKVDLGYQVTRFVDKVTRQARKNGYGCCLGTQKFEHIQEDGLLDQFQHFFIGSQLPSSYKAIQAALDLTDENMYVVSNAHMDPGRKCDMALYIPATGVLEIVRFVQSGFEYWMRTTTAPEREMIGERIKVYTRDHGLHPVEAFIRAAKALATEYPRGLIATNLVEI